VGNLIPLSLVVLNKEHLKDVLEEIQIPQLQLYRIGFNTLFKSGYNLLERRNSERKPGVKSKKSGALEYWCFEVCFGDEFSP